ncbi:hypothetical protein T11_9344 [Trichinella zimbabwensis]|uniref:Uncharacterized protein n=1 Tax=Trichinella zimbabwensis TaxID=268475 RepID=A0A0V1HXR9_9BILA|nr:hypothetical protein T11_9344 [Trichinella zimbabwensis]
MYSRPSTFAICAFRRNRECRISANTCRFCSYTPPMPYNPTQLPESCKRYHGPSTDLHVKYLSSCQKWMDCLAHLFLTKHCDYSSFMHYVFTQILRYSHAVLDCASMKAEVWTCPDITGAAVDQSPRLFCLPLWLSRYHHCYGVERHKRKRLCTEPAVPQHTCTLGSKNRIYLFG